MVLVLSMKKVFLEIKSSIFPPKYARYGQNLKKQNCSSQEDIKFCSRLFFDRTRSFCIDRRESYLKWKIPFCTKSMRDMKKLLRNKILCFKNIYNYAIRLGYYFIGVVYIYFLSIKNVFLKIKKSIFPPKYTRYGKMLRNKLFYFKDI